MVYTLYHPVDDFDDVEVILEQIEIKTADYYKLRCVSCNKKTIVNVLQNMSLSIWVNSHFSYFYFMPVI